MPRRASLSPTWMPVLSRLWRSLPQTPSCAPPLQAREPGGGALASEQLLAVAVDHGGGFSAPGLEDRRQFDAGGDHVLGGADPGAVPGKAVDHRRPKLGPAGHLLEVARDLARVEALADAAALVHRGRQTNLRCHRQRKSSVPTFIARDHCRDDRPHDGQTLAHELGSQRREVRTPRVRLTLALRVALDRAERPARRTACQCRERKISE